MRPTLNQYPVTDARTFRKLGNNMEYDYPKFINELNKYIDELEAKLQPINPSPDSECAGCKHEKTRGKECGSCDDITDKWEPKEAEKSCETDCEYCAYYVPGHEGKRMTCILCINHSNYTPPPSRRK